MIFILHYEGWLFDKSVDAENYCDAKGKKFDSSKKDAKYGTVPAFYFSNWTRYSNFWMGDRFIKNEKR